MNGYLMAAVLIFAVGLPLLCVAVWASCARTKNKNFYAAYNALKQALVSAQARYRQNQDELNRLGFYADSKKDVGRRHFLFDNAKGLAAVSTYYFDDRFLHLTPKDFRTDSYQVLGLFQYPKSSCSELTVFYCTKIVECVLVQDGAVVKSSAGTAVLAGTNVPMLGVLQGKAASASNEHQTGLLSVRLTLDDRQTPSVIFHFTDGGVDKSSPQYAAAFQEAQEVFGIFDAIARMNNKAQTPAAQAAAPPAPPAPVQREDVFEKIRQLGRLREEKLLTEEEFAAKKKALMEQIR